MAAMANVSKQTPVAHHIRYDARCRDNDVKIKSLIAKKNYRYTVNNVKDNFGHN